jgi:RNA polymerase sigma-70 factor (ECF subfamily)
VKKVTKAERKEAVTKTAPVNPLQKEDSSSTPPDEDSSLIRRASSGDAEALNRLLMRAQEMAWRFSTSVCGGGSDAEDAMQEALIKTYRYFSRIRQPEAFRPWLYRTVRNACLMGRRKRVGEPTRLQSLDDLLPGPDGSMSFETPDPGKDPEQLASNAALGRRLRKALAALPPSYRAIVFLREMEGLSTREVAAIMRISEDNVKTRLHRARLQLQAELAGGRR